jgi:hypothetical protein
MKTALYLNSTNYEIVDQNGKVLTIEEAKNLWENTKIENHNLAFSRLVQFGFDLAAVKSYYGM